MRVKVILYDAFYTSKMDVFDTDAGETADVTAESLKGVIQL